MRVPLNQGAYQARSLIANAQRCVNLYPEKNAEDSPVKYTHYTTPGLDLKLAGPIARPVRCTYRSSAGELFTVIGGNVYYVDSSFTATFLGAITDAAKPVSMADNGLAIVVVDGTSSGYAIDMSDHRFGTINSPYFYGADRADVLDTFLLFNRPGTTQFYISLSEVTYDMLVGSTAFDGLDIAAKVGYPDPLATLIVMRREIWLVGTLTTEVWYNSGAAAFPFERMPGVFVEWGCIAKYSLAAQDLSIYWLSQNKQGEIIVIRGTNYQALRISTHAIENEFDSYSDVSDAIGYTYQQEGHTFYVLTFPSANKTWVYDQSTEEWHERAYTDNNGGLNRIRANCTANVYGFNIVGDWQNGNLYAFNLDTFTDNGQPITRIRGFPHLLDEGRRLFHTQFIADMQVGTAAGTLTSQAPVVLLRWSDTRGASWGNPVEQSIGAAGEYLVSVQFQRLGMARDRVYELEWSAPYKTALNGAWLQTKTAAT